MKESYPEELSLCHRIVSEKSLSFFKIQAANLGDGEAQKTFTKVIVTGLKEK